MANANNKAKTKPMAKQHCTRQKKTGCDRDLAQGMQNLSLDSSDFETQNPGTTTIIKRPRVTYISYLAADFERICSAYYIEESIKQEFLDVYKPPVQKSWKDDRSEEDKAAAEMEFRRQDYFCCPYSRGRGRDFRTLKFRPFTQLRGRGGPPIRGSDFRIYKPHTYYSQRKLKIETFEDFIKYS